MMSLLKNPLCFGLFHLIVKFEYIFSQLSNGIFIRLRCELLNMNSCFSLPSFPFGVTAEDPFRMGNAGNEKQNKLEN